MTAPTPSLVLVGPMGAGKTSIGRRVARTLGVPFVDTDAAIVRAHGPIPDLFRHEGEARFRAIERETVAQALAEPGVISLGGGAVLDERTRDDLASHPVVFLSVAPQVVSHRIAGGSRPLLDGGDPVEQWQRIFAERKPLYDAVADVEFDTSRGPLSDVVAAIVAWARSRAEGETPA
ncbi:MAG: shikimate kinase [Microbacterium sp.]|uniref:shikimate kinase n=1 Tax=Microbacterium sp. TaxID=51671 RepID=UPI0026039AE6|nr:shikimate kinase [Microbacterium sp.]MCX6501209.1 shikimate kinase [Microbacterium sp.]